MRLGISSAAAPDLPLQELVGACRRRGLSALQLEAGHAHGVVGAARAGEGRGGPGKALADSPLTRTAARVREQGVDLVGFRLSRLDDVQRPGVLLLSASLGAPLVAPAATAAGSDAILAAADACHGAGARLLIAHGSNATQAAALRRVAEEAPPGSVALAWDVSPLAGDLEGEAAAVLDAAGDALRLIRLAGGGPESAGEEGRGVGALMGRLALERWNGAIVLAPSTTRYLRAWSGWLGRRGGWGCGSKAEPAPLRLLGQPEVTS